MRSDEFAFMLQEITRVSQTEGHGLTDRELEVLRLVAKAKSTDDIAAELFLSIHTVRNHVRNILSTLGAHTRLEAVAIAARDGILSLDDIGQPGDE